MKIFKSFNRLQGNDLWLFMLRVLSHFSFGSELRRKKCVTVFMCTGQTSNDHYFDESPRNIFFILVWRTLTCFLFSMTGDLFCSFSSVFLNTYLFFIMLLSGFSTISVVFRSTFTSFYTFGCSFYAFSFFNLHFICFMCFLNLNQSVFRYTFCCFLPSAVSTLAAVLSCQDDFCPLVSCPLCSCNQPHLSHLWLAVSWCI